MSAYPSLPLFTDAFIADTGHLSAQETGAYLMLLMMAWRLPTCSLPDDDAKLAKWARVDRRTWARIKPAVMDFWELHDGTWTQKRLTKEREIVSKRAEVARQNGQHGGRPKPLKNKDADNPEGSLRVSQTKAPNPNPRRDEDDDDDARARDRADPSPKGPLGTHWLSRGADVTWAREHLPSAEVDIVLQQHDDHWSCPRTDAAFKTPAGWSASWRQLVLEIAARRQRATIIPISAARQEASHGRVNSHANRGVSIGAIWREAVGEDATEALGEDADRSEVHDAPRQRYAL
jgi:uncharacterized protein YdaU (DUF1376 family)